MSVAGRSRGRSSDEHQVELQLQRKLQIVPIVYYLSRNGHLEHPHFVEIRLPDSRKLFLRDVIDRLNLLRGKGMASQYSWSSKRSYKNGYVWQDLEENDFIHPVHGGDYVLKGSEIPQTLSKSPETSSSSSSKTTLAGDSRRNQSWGTNEYKTESARELPGKTAADASTQTEEKRRHKAETRVVEELSKDEVSPPPSDSSPETLESLMNADGRLLIGSSSNPTAGSGRMKGSPSVLMSLISCGSMSFRECGATTVKEHGHSPVSSYTGSSIGKMGLEDKQYFSGSVIDNKHDKFDTLKRTNSYNHDQRNPQMELEEKEEECARVRCIPRRPKIAQVNIKKQVKPETSSNTQEATT